MSFVQRQIEVEITLGTGDFGNGKGNTVTLSGYQIHADITKGGQPSWDTADIRIWGLSLDLLNTLTRLGKPVAYSRNNTITVKAGDEDSGLSQVYRGIIMGAYGDFDASPDVSLVITSSSSPVIATQPQKPLSFPGSSDVAVICAQIAAQLGLGFVNDGVSYQVTDQYLPGASTQQLDKLSELAHFWYTTQGGVAGQSLEIWPRGKARGEMGPLISPDTGLVGYPKYSDAGVIITALYKPGIGLGTAFTLKTYLSTAIGTWYVLQVYYQLECLNPSGDNPWFMRIDAQRAKYAT